MREKISKVYPAFFFEEVAKKNRVDVKVVEELYHHYTQRVKFCLRTEPKVVMKGLGTFEYTPGKLLKYMYNFAKYLDRHPTSFADVILKKHDAWYTDISEIYKELLKLNQTYEYIKGSIEKLRLNYRRFEEFFDNKGNRRRNFEIENGEMQTVSIQLSECETGGV
tara:strand:+ start:1000 stop:1494 length:495 start_codon:yes stop_codon:yes gene_type:complete